MPIVWVIFALYVPLSQNPALDSAQVPACRSCWGKRIRHTFGTVFLCVPHGMKVQREAGFEGDIRDVVTINHLREIASLTIYSNISPSGYRKFTPEWFPSEAAGHTSVRDWRCSEGTFRDLRLTRDGRQWRLITFPFGYAEYSDLSAHNATRLDRVLDSLCCHPLP